MMKSALTFLIAALISTAAAFAQTPPTSGNPGSQNKTKNVWAGDNFEQVCITQAIGSPGTFTPICPSNNITITASGQTIALPIVGTPPGYQPGQVTKSVELNIFYAAPYVPIFAPGYGWQNGVTPAACSAGATGCLSRVISANPDVIECRTVNEAAVRCGPPLVAIGSMCPQSATFIGRTTGENTGALTAFICGMVTDGLIDSDASMASTGANPFCGSGSVFDVLIIHAMANATDALLDVCNRVTATNNGATFTPNNGFAGASASTTYINTGYNMSTGAGVASLNSAHMGVWSLTDMSSTASQVIGVSTGGNGIEIEARYSDGQTYVSINNATTSYLVTTTTPRSDGWLLAQRTSASARAYYRAASLLVSDAQASTAIPNSNLGDVGIFGNSSPFGWPGIVAMWSAGKSFTSGQITGFNARGCTYITTVLSSKPSYCP